MKEGQKKRIEYYIFIDYSEYIIGYNIIEAINLNLILPKIIRFRHYKDNRHKKIYLLKIKREIKSSNLSQLLLRQKILSLKDNLLLFADVIGFIKSNCESFIFISVDDNHVRAFSRLLYMLPIRCNLIIRKESELKINSPEYRMSLIIDTMLNIERMSK